MLLMVSARLPAVWSWSHRFTLSSCLLEASMAALAWSSRDSALPPSRFRAVVVAAVALLYGFAGHPAARLWQRWLLQL